MKEHNDDHKNEQVTEHGHPHKEDVHEHKEQQHEAHGHDHADDAHGGAHGHTHGTIDPSIAAVPYVREHLLCEDVRVQLAARFRGRDYVHS